MFIFMWLVFCVLASVLAAARGRNPVGWFVVAFILSPLIAALLVLVLPNRKMA